MRVRLRISSSGGPRKLRGDRGACTIFGCSKVVIYVIVVGKAICCPRVHTPVLTQEIEGEAET